MYKQVHCSMYIHIARGQQLEDIFSDNYVITKWMIIRKYVRRKKCLKYLNATQLFIMARKSNISYLLNRIKKEKKERRILRIYFYLFPKTCVF